MAYLLPRFIEPHAGRVLFDGEDSAWVTLESLRADTIYVGGSDPFFTGTVYENISCGNPKYLMQAVIDAAKLSHAHDFIQRLSQGYNTMLGEHGEQLDLGQSFRLGLARAALRDPALLIVEEPEGRLDDDAKSDIDDTYSQLLPDRTLLFLPSRLSTMKRVDRIVLIQNGKVVADGPHAKLVQSSALYRHWEYINFNEFRHALEPVGS
jgi:ABC-type multidrug transport system fused ATPase/permease subunit